MQNFGFSQPFNSIKMKNSSIILPFRYHEFAISKWNFEFYLENKTMRITKLNFKMLGV